MRIRSRQTLALLGLTLLALLFRTRQVVGFGLGDDAFYAGMSSDLFDRGLAAWSPDFGSNYRFGLWIPLVASFKLFGISDVSFVAFALLSSVLLVPVVYLLGRELVDERAGLFAALVQTVSSFDIAFSTTLTIDIPVSFLLSLSLLLFLRAEKAAPVRSLLLNFMAAFAILWAYFIKLPAPSIMLVFAALTLLRREHWKKHLGLYASFGALLGATFLLDYGLHGDPLNYLHNELKFAAGPSPFASAYLLYPKWMFTNENWIRSFYFGFHFHLAAIGLVYCLARRATRRQILPFAVWFLPIFLFLELYPAGWQLPYEVLPRYFRYVHAFVPPTSLIAGVFLASLWAVAGGAGRRLASRTHLGAFASALPRLALGLLVLAWCQLSVSGGLAIARLYGEYFADARIATARLASLPPRPIYSDNNLHDRFDFDTGYRRRHQAQWNANGVSIQADIVGRSLEPLRGLTDGYVVLGGSRGVNYGAALLQGSFQPPESWELILEIEAPIDRYRLEPLRIYAVSAGKAGS